MNDPTRVWIIECQRRCILRSNIERNLPTWDTLFAPWILYEGVQSQEVSSGKTPGNPVGFLRSGSPRSPQAARFKGLKSTLFFLGGRSEESSESATRGSLLWIWDKPRPRAKLQRVSNPLEKRPIRQNTLNFSFRGLDNGVNYNPLISLRKGELDIVALAAARTCIA
jgi:hypothetical protein